MIKYAIAALAFCCAGHVHAQDAEADAEAHPAPAPVVTHADARTAHGMVAGIQAALTQRYEIRARVTEAWMVSDPSRHLFCGSFLTPDQRRRHFIASLDGLEVHATEVEDGIFYVSACRLPGGVVFAGNSRH